MSGRVAIPERSSSPIRVTSCHDGQANWPWIAPIYRGEPQIEWRSISTCRSPLLARLPGPHLGRIRAALSLRYTIARRLTDLIVSHGPYTSYYMEAFGRTDKLDIPHVAFAFNFTDLPTGYRLDAMRSAFRHVDRFVVYSEFERQYYASRFDLPIERLRFIRWGVAPPIENAKPDRMAIPYVAALGGEARDYRTLCEAARRLPHRHFVIVVRPHSLDGIDVPNNVTAHVSLPFDEAWSIVWHAAVAVIPLRTDLTANGHVSLVGGMHMGKAQVVTASAGVADYVEDGRTGLTVPAADAAALAEAIERLMGDESLRQALGTEAAAFAAEYCSEKVTVEGFRTLLADLQRGS